jgi:hypothetical protein
MGAKANSCPGFMPQANAGWYGEFSFTTGVLNAPGRVCDFKISDSPPMKPVSTNADEKLLTDLLQEVGPA